MSKVLFVLKRREDYSAEMHYHIGVSTGLFNSASFMNDMLVDLGIDSKMVVVIDNNCIDREVTKHNPTHVIIEALWVVPSKFYTLCQLHPKVKWIIRLHSEIPFLANEGMAMDWLGDYAPFENVIIAANAPRILVEVRDFLKFKMDWSDKTTNQKVIYLPNFYPQNYRFKCFNKNKKHIDIGCFGAVRPLKNHLTQALAAIKFANTIGKELHFHINAGRVEQKGDSVLNNLKGLFGHLHHKGHLLINHQWTPRDEFIKLCSQMDIGMQVSFSETFNIVGADLISQGVPLVGSPEIPWIDNMFSAQATESEKMYNKLLLTYKIPYINSLKNQFFLYRYTNETKKCWLKHLKK